MRIYGWKLVTVSCHPAMIGDNWPSACGDTKYLMLRDLTKPRD